MNLPFLSLASPFLVFQRKPHPQATYSKWPHRLFTLITHQSSPTINFGFSIFCKYSHILIQKLMHEFNKDGQWVMRLEYGRHALLCSLWLEPREWMDGRQYQTHAYFFLMLSAIVIRFTFQTCFVLIWQLN